MVEGEERRVCKAVDMAKILRGGRDQQRVGEWKCTPKTIPEVVGPKDLSKLGQGGASLTLRSLQRDW